MGGKGIGKPKPPLKMKQLQTNLINCVKPVKGQGAITAGNASARLKHWQRESEGRGRDEPFRQAWLHAGEPSHPWVRQVCLSGRSSCLPRSCLCPASSSVCIDANRQQLSRNEIRHHSCHYACAQCTPAPGPQFRAGGGIGWMEEAGENWAGTGVVLSLTCAFSATHA